MFDGESAPTTPNVVDCVSNTDETPQRRPIACLRCRERKVKCDRGLPACSYCQKARIQCIGAPKVEKSRIPELEKRIAELEESLRIAENERLYPDASTVNGHQPDDNVFTEPSVFGQIENGSVLNNQHVTTQLNANNVQPSTGPHAQQYLTTMPSLANTDSRPTLQVLRPPPLIDADEPIAHEVGLISLANSSEPKYLGPSSGISFAKLIYASSPQTQGLPVTGQRMNLDGDMQQLYTSNITQSAVNVPTMTDMLHFLDAYLMTYQPLYPFLDEVRLETLTDELCKLKCHSTNKVSLEKMKDICSPYEELELLCIFHLGAKILEIRLSQDFASESYMLAALERQGQINLHDSIAGVQAMLLLLLSSLHSPSGLNAWFLKSTLIASCVDLGLQRARKYTARSRSGQRDNEVEAGIFWSVYSLERSLSVILGRPLTLRDEAIDVDFPGCHGTEEVHLAAVNTSSMSEPSSKRQRSNNALSPAVYSFRFDRLTAEIKLMLYRVAQSPSRFPWPEDIPQWTETAHAACQKILDDSRDGTSSRRTDVAVLLTLEVKYHQCIMLLYRPSPALPRPTALALKRCFDSAFDTIRIMSELARFGNLTYSWLNVHVVLIAGITILYCLWISPQIRTVTSLEHFTHHADMCKELLIKLSAIWSVAGTAGQKFQNMAEITKSTWEKGFPKSTSLRAQVKDISIDEAANDTSDLPEPSLAGFGLLPNGEIDWNSFDLNYNFVDPLFDTLGPMSDLFDLDWIPDLA